MNNKIHIGQLIKKHLKEKNISVETFASSLKLSNNSVYKILKKEYVSTKLLLKINNALNYNYFTCFSENNIETPISTLKENNLRLNQELQQSRQKNEELQKEVEYLKKIVALSEKKQG